MTWRGTRDEARQRLLEAYNSDEVDRYEQWVRAMSAEDHQAFFEDLKPEFSFRQGMSVLDVGAGTGAMCVTLSSLPGISLTALEPLAEMLDRLSRKPELKAVKAVQGFSDSPEDRDLFDEGCFDVIVSRQLANGLFDPLAAFSNWFHWLREGGTVLLTDGCFTRESWAGPLASEVDRLPLSISGSISLVPYLLHSVGFTVQASRLMAHTNQLESTRTERFLVIAEKPPGDNDRSSNTA